MGIGMGMGLQLSIRQIPMLLCDSIFPGAAALLEQTEYMDAISGLLPRGGTPRYRSVMDAMFVRLFPWHRKNCITFYRGKGKQLVHILTCDQVKQYDLMLVVAIEAAHQVMQQRLRVGWDSYRGMCIELFLSNAGTWE